MEIEPVPGKKPEEIFHIVTTASFRHNKLRRFLMNNFKTLVIVTAINISNVFKKYPNNFTQNPNSKI
jgi:hypothetical protein